MSNGRDWRSYIGHPPEWHRWEVIEWIRPEPGQSPDEHEDEPHAMSRSQALINPQWNVYGVYWRPVL